MDLALLLLLIIFNGIFSMSEIALVSSRNARLQKLAEDGSSGAQSALQLHDNPSSFLSTVQVGITSVGVLSGALGESVIADPLAGWLGQFPLVAEHARAIAITLTVTLITYASVVLGELVPKRLGLLAPERVASVAARPMMLLARITKPLVWLLSASSDLIMRILRIRHNDGPPVTDDEIKVLMEQGTEAGIFDEGEQEIVSNVLRLDEQRIGAIMTPRRDIAYLDCADSEDEIRQRLHATPYGRLVVCREGLDNVLGVVQTAELLKRQLRGEPLDLARTVHAPLYVPDSITTSQLLENFRQSRTEFALIVDEYGELEGVVTLADVLTSIVGDLPSGGAHDNPDIVKRDSESWLIDGDVAIERIKGEIDMDIDLPGEEEGEYHTLGGLVMHVLGRLPRVADRFEVEGWRLEVVDMDRNRVDKVLVTRLAPPPDEDG